MEFFKKGGMRGQGRGAGAGDLLYLAGYNGEVDMASVGLLRRASGHSRAGFTLIELLVVVSIIALLISILLPSLGKAKELANRAYCAANLHGLTESMITYQQDFSCFPTTSPPTSANSYTGVPATGTPEGFPGADQTLAKLPTVMQGSPSACLWILNLRNQAPAKIFLCKSDRYVITPAQNMDQTTGNWYCNFQGPTQISYSITYPWTSGGTVTAAWRGGDMSSNTPLMSDIAPLAEANVKQPDGPKGTTGKLLNTASHESAGQNVSYGDGHVDWCRDPYCGANNENIFTVQTASGGAFQPGTAISSPGTLPASPAMNGDFPDTVMVPVRKTSDGTIGP
ncbi:MAG: type II secretion system protein [Phycisphaerae bacterium]